MASSTSNLPATFKGDFLDSSHPDYEASIVRWAANAKLHAKYVAFVKDVGDVGIALRYAQDNGLAIAIHGGGHSVSSASSVEGGLVVDLARHLGQVRVDKEKSLAYVGGGAIWGTVDKEGMKYGLATVAGTVSHTGVGGLVLGGGWGWLTGRHGMAVDNLVQATIVTASGDILTVSDTENSDLFFGIRGGGSNFGVCTEFVLRMHPQRATVYAGKMIFLPHSAERLVSLVNITMKHGLSPDQAMSLVFTVDPQHRKPCIVLVVFFNGSRDEGEEAYRAFIDLGPIVNDAKEIPYETLNTIQDIPLAYGSNCYVNSTAHKFGPSIHTANWLLSTVGDVATKSCIKPSVIFDITSLDKVLSVPRSQTAFRRDPTPHVGIVMMWPGEEGARENHVLAKTTAKEVGRFIKEEQSMLGEGEGGVDLLQGMGYSNLDSDAATVEKTPLAYGENYARLRELKRQYDPTQVFDRWFPIEPAAEAA